MFTHSKHVRQFAVLMSAAVVMALAPQMAHAQGGRTPDEKPTVKASADSVRAKVTGNPAATDTAQKALPPAPDGKAATKGKKRSGWAGIGAILDAMLGVKQPKRSW